MQGWIKEATDSVSGRTIYGREVKTGSHGNYGTNSFRIEREFQVRDPSGRVLLQTSGTASGEYWCGVFLFFVVETDGAIVRLQQSDKPDDVQFDVPDIPLPLDKVWM